MLKPLGQLASETASERRTKAQISEADVLELRAFVGRIQAPGVVLDQAGRERVTPAREVREMLLAAKTTP